MRGQPGEWTIERRGHGLNGPSRTKSPAPISSGIQARVRPCPGEREMAPKPGDQVAHPRDGPPVWRVTRSGHQAQDGKPRYAPTQERIISLGIGQITVRNAAGLVTQEISNSRD